MLSSTISIYIFLKSIIDRFDENIVYQIIEIQLNHMRQTKYITFFFQRRNCYEHTSNNNFKSFRNKKFKIQKFSVK